jgi:hypothetical protein
MELATHGHNYRQLAEEIGEVLQAAAETADKMQEDARVEAARFRAEAETEHRQACTEARRIVDEARMEADMVRAEAEWQSQEIIAQARRQAAERLAGADHRLTEVSQAESRVIERLAGVGQVVADALATLREGPGTAMTSAGTATTTSADTDTTSDGGDPDAPDDDPESPSAKVYFVEFPPATPPPTSCAPDPEAEILPTQTPGASLFADEAERSEWAPPSSELPAWWTRGGAQG